MSDERKISIHLDDAGFGTLVVDGHDLSHLCTSGKVEFGVADRPVATLVLSTLALELEAPAEVVAEILDERKEAQEGSAEDASENTIEANDLEELLNDLERMKLAATIASAAITLANALMKDGRRECEAYLKTLKELEACGSPDEALE